MRFLLIPPIRARKPLAPHSQTRRSDASGSRELARDDKLNGCCTCAYLLGIISQSIFCKRCCALYFYFSPCFSLSLSYSLTSLVGLYLPRSSDVSVLNARVNPCIASFDLYLYQCVRVPLLVHSRNILFNSRKQLMCTEFKSALHAR